ncbi:MULTISPECIES: Cof-type HAD-IIB family hydrolase [unclassified Enterococcus]|uniref:Cof-type HAD-IIB family hydrolase n=1 Tax=unclassified Enterococcus TaxID=2608891 RepID=UPI000A33A9FB|nr:MULTISPECIES: Cof-type HAD-IIB family hydrolase [unclassified Enterococcus]OTO77331.1 hypothetical protein A5865_001207 [Enterococcus sp. 12E11_DIV0728]OUZ16500.1 hypothetical protein A5868_001421 [Enterococcus sp. 12F9_DIV0723]
MELVAIDLDGTLLNSHHQVPEANSKALRRLNQNGVEIVIATGRSVISASEIVQELGVSAHILALNGTYITKISETGQMTAIRRKLIGREIVKKALKIAEALEITFIASNETGSDRVMFKQAPEVVQEFLKDRPDLRVITKKEMDQKIEDPSTEYLKIAFTDENVENLYTLRQALSQVGLYTIFSDTYYIELVPEGINKGEALSYLCQCLKIPLEKTLAFGDQENDIEMLQIAGLGIAMGNANKHVKEVANKITGTNNEAGVAEVLNEYF